MSIETFSTLVAIIVTAITSVALAYKAGNKVRIIATVKEQTLALFLYAEKQDWINEDKMGWVVQQVYRRIPPKALRIISKFFQADDVEQLVERLYQEAKKQLHKTP